MHSFTGIRYGNGRRFACYFLLQKLDRSCSLFTQIGIINNNNRSYFNIWTTPLKWVKWTLNQDHCIIKQ